MSKEMHDRILRIVGSSQKKRMEQKELQNALNLSGSAAMIEFDKTLWQMEKDLEIFRNKQNELMTRDQMGLFEGVIRIRRNGAGSIERNENETLKVDEFSQLDAMDGDTVLVQREGVSGYGKVVKILKRAKSFLLGTYAGKGPSLKLVLDDPVLEAWPRKVTKNASYKPVEGLKVKLNIVQHGKPLQLNVAEVLGHKDDPGVDILSILLDKGIEPDFPAEVLDQLDTVPEYVSAADLDGRRDLRDENFITIDGDDSKDFDDAVSVTKEDGGWFLQVSIADVSHYVTANSPLDNEAYQRGCSVYAVDTVVPMLPHELSNGICSLNPDVDRLTITCAMHVTGKGEIREYDIFPSVIHSKARMTYHNVNLILDGDEALKEEYSCLGSLFNDLADCADAIRQARKAKGAIDFDTRESQIICDEEGKAVDVYEKVRGHAERMIEDCMIAANVTVAAHLKWQDIPAVYRVHEQPAIKKMREFSRMSELMGRKFIVGQNDVYANEIQRYLDLVRDTEEYPVLSMMLLRCMKKARYDEVCLGHFGLGEEEYLHFTSPIRRYPDLVVHRMLRKYCFESCTDSKERLNDMKFVQAASEQSSIRERMSVDAEYAASDMKKAEYMMRHIGDRYEGIISSVTAFGMYVQLPNTVEGMVRAADIKDDYYEYDRDRMVLVGQNTGKMYRPGMKVIIEVTGADKDTAKIDFALRDRLEKPARSFERRDRFQKGRSSGPKDFSRRGSYGKDARRGRENRFEHKPAGSNRSEGRRVRSADVMEGKTGERNGRNRPQSSGPRRRSFAPGGHARRGNGKDR